MPRRNWALGRGAFGGGERDGAGSARAVRRSRGLAALEAAQRVACAYWSDGAIQACPAAIRGSRTFKRELASQLHGADTADRKQLGLAPLDTGQDLVTWRRLRVDLG